MAELVSGGGGTDGQLTLKTTDDQVAARLFTEAEHTDPLSGGGGAVTPGGGRRSRGRITSTGPAGVGAVIGSVLVPGSDTFEVGHGGAAGATGRAGNINVKGASGSSVISLSSGYAADAGATVTIGAGGHPGTLRVQSTEGRSAFQVSSPNDTVMIDVGHKGRVGQLRLMDAQGNQRVGLDATLGQIFLLNDAGLATVMLDAMSGDVILSNADIAEEFDVDSDVAPGCVVRVGASGRLELTATAYDTTVVGVVSGHSAFRPGIVLDRKRRVGERRLPVAMLGKVVCLADASAAPIRPGTLLTSSDRPGHAMAALDPTKALGAIVGKALGNLLLGQGTIPMLVALR